MTKIDYVQLEPKALMAELAAMNTPERGAYCSLFTWLYLNKGRCPKDLKKIRQICGNPRYFDKIWSNIRHKFPEKTGFIYHKRVSLELRKAKRAMQTKRRAGLIGAKARWQGHGDRIPTSMPNENENETKPNTKENNITNKRKSFSQSSSSSASLRFNDSLQVIIRPRTSGDRTSFRNLTNWLGTQIEAGKMDDSVYGRVLDIAKEAAKKGRIPPAMFFDILKREMGYHNGRKGI